MTDDLVQRLRDRKGFFLNGAAWVMSCDPDPDCADAADEIERLRACLRYEQHRFATLNTHSDGCHAAGPVHYECAIAEIARLRAELEKIRTAGETREIECLCDIRIAVGDPHGRLMQGELVEHIRGIVSELAAFGRRYADSESRLAECDAALQTVQAELAALRKRVEDAPVALVDRWAGGVWVLHKADLSAVCEPLRGKRVRLVVEG